MANPLDTAISAVGKGISAGKDSFIKIALPLAAGTALIAIGSVFVSKMIPK